MLLNDLPKTGRGGTFTVDHLPPYKLNDQAILSCDPGYKAPTTSISTVLKKDDTLVWDPPTINCNPVQCLPPDIPQHGSVSDTSYHFPNSFSYVCEDGYKLNQDKKEYFCSPSGAWIPSIPYNIRCNLVKCPPLKAPENGSLSMNDRHFRAVATFRCNDNYSMIRGQKKRVCQGDGTWSGDEVICGRTPCPPMAPSVKVLMSSDIINVIDCGNGKHIPVKCKSNGQWSLVFPYCNGIINTFNPQSPDGMDEPVFNRENFPPIIHPEPMVPAVQQPPIPVVPNPLNSPDSIKPVPKINFPPPVISVPMAPPIQPFIFSNFLNSKNFSFFWGIAILFLYLGIMSYFWIQKKSNFQIL